jgi:hypothetical protein
MELVLKNLKSILITLALIAFAIVFYLNSSSIVDWFKRLFTDVQPNEVPTSSNLTDSTYKISPKIISNYVDTIISSIDQLGTDEKSLHNIFLDLKNTSIENTISLWNEYNGRALKYSPALGQYVRGVTLFTGAAQYNLYQVLKSELNGLAATKSENSEWVNWDWLLRTQAHLV